MIPSSNLFTGLSLVSGQSYTVTVSDYFAPSKSTIVSIQSSVLLGSAVTLTLQSSDNSGNAFYSSLYVYSLTYTGPTTGSVTPVHSANGLYSASFTPSKSGSYTVSVNLSNFYTSANPSVSKEISGSPKVVAVIAPTWSTAALTQTVFFIYAPNADTVTLPPQTESGFNTASYTHEVFFISSTTYSSSAACNTNGDDTCYTSARNINNISSFSVVLMNLSAITFTVNALITDRNYLSSSWKIVHRIKQGTTVLGFKDWEISFNS